MDVGKERAHNMIKKPELAVKVISSHTPHINRTMRVIGGLHYIKVNQKPYFTLTVDIHRKGFPNQMQSFGCDHATILKHFPKFADLAALHLSDIDGAPLHDESNAWYDLAGALPDNAGEQYHAGKSLRHFPKPEGAPRRGEWDDTDYRNPTSDECLKIFADHVRVDIDTARQVRDKVVEVALDARYEMGEPKYSWYDGRAWLKQWIEEQRPRWKQEAEACIARHGLIVFGDTWPDSGLE